MPDSLPPSVDPSLGSAQTPLTLVSEAMVLERFGASGLWHWHEARAALSRVYGQVDGLMGLIWPRLCTQHEARDPSLKAQDLRAQDLETRGLAPDWRKPGSALYCAYIDRFSGTLKGAIDKIPYLQSLNVGIFHPLPLLRPRSGDNDGGFAVEDYRDIDPRLGSLADLKDLTKALGQAEIRLVLDVVCNHTAKEHAWAKAFAAKDPAFKDFYLGFETQAEVDEWEAHLLDVFPETAPGSFTYDAASGLYIWTSFYPYQWDLNYGCPQVFVEMLDVLMFLANQGVGGFRLDSAPFLWKEKGTPCRGLPQTHDLLKAFVHLMRLQAPSVFFLAEAIEDLNTVLPFFGQDHEHRECDMAYNNSLMTALWAGLAEGKGEIVHQALDLAAQKPKHGVWLNYARCHDDIIWGALGNLASRERQKAWSRFYDQNLNPDGYAQGLGFQGTKGAALSTCGMAYSLCGGSSDGLADKRHGLIYGLVYALDGVPMVYMGDEIGLENDPSFAQDPEKASELRWLHRPHMDWAASQTKEAQARRETILRASRALKLLPQLQEATAPQALLGLGPELLGFERRLPDAQFICIANLSDRPSWFDAGQGGHDLLSGQRLQGRSVLDAYQLVWLLRLDETPSSES